MTSALPLSLTNTTRRCALALSLLAAACTPGTGGSETEQGSDTGSATVASTDTTAGTDTATSTTVGPTTSPTDDTGELCVGFEDAAPESSVMASIQNNLDVAVFVEVKGQCDARVLELYGPDDLDAPTPWLLGDCWTCSGAMDGSCVCPGAPCQLTSFLKIFPGASYGSLWSGAVYQDATLPEGCVDAACPAECRQRLTADAGSYAFRVTAGASASGCAGDCDCEDFGEGWCFVEGEEGQLDGDPIVYERVIDYPRDAIALIVIE